MCLMDLLGREPETTNEYARAFGGALIVVGIARELTLIRRLIRAALPNGK